jgi:hypothetical protein
MAVNQTGQQKKSRLLSESGLATVEAVPILILFIVLWSYGLGIFGAIHTGILNSIAARNYAFEAFANRADLQIHRNDPISLSEAATYKNRENRLHTVVSETVRGDERFPATERPLAKGLPNAPEEDNRTATYHSDLIGLYDRLYSRNQTPRSSDVDVAPIWIQVGHGICLNSRCGDE